MRIKGVIFDLDGTLLDSLGDVSSFANAVLLSYGFDARTKEEYRYLAGQGAYNLMKASSGCNDDGLIFNMANKFRELYESSKGSSKPYEGIQELLDSLFLAGIKTAVLSNKPDNLTKQCVQEFFGTHPFLAVFGQKEGGSVKPDPSGALEIAEIFGLSPSEIAVVGDTKNDILAAVNGGFYPIGVSWGFRDKEELFLNGAKIVVDTPTEVLSAICYSVS